MSEPATVLRVDRRRICVDTDGGDSLDATVRGRIHGAARREKGPVAVGDRVRIDRVSDGTAVIVEVEPRHSVLLRPEAGGRWRNQVLVANADRAILVFAHADPAPHGGLIDRLLVACHAGDVPPLLVFNKTDLPASPHTRSLIELYEGLGYEVVRTCANSGEGVDRLVALTAGRSSVFAGPSGSGKSSLINRVLPGVELRTGEISRSTGKGRHTTTAANLVRIPGGGHVVDTPGVREFGIASIPPGELDLHFPEFPVPGHCRFLDCRHVSEPGCAVVAAVEARTVHPSRYGSYLALLAEVEGRD